MSAKYAAGKLSERRTARSVRAASRMDVPRVKTIQLARKLLTLHAREYDNDLADERNLEFETLAVSLARCVMGIPEKKGKGK